MRTSTFNCVVASDSLCSLPITTKTYTCTHSCTRYVSTPPLGPVVLTFALQGGQQSQVVFDDPESLKKFPKFKDAKAVEAILEPGDVLYLPPMWFHHVTALEMSVSVSIWSRPQETLNMWEVERLPLPISKEMTPDMKALAMRIYLDIILGDVLGGHDKAVAFVEALLEERFQVLISEV